MEQAGSELTAFDKTVVFLDYFKVLPDPRQAGKVIYPLPEVLLLCLLAVLAGAETFVDIARFGEKKIDLLRRFGPFRHGTPAHDHLGDILSVLDAAQYFCKWHEPSVLPTARVGPVVGVLLPVTGAGY